MPYRTGETQWELVLRIDDDDDVAEVNEQYKSSITFLIDSSSTRHLILKEEPDITLDTTSRRIIIPKITVDEQDFMSSTYEDAYPTISNFLVSLVINPEDKEKIGYSLITQTRDLVRRNSAGGNKYLWFITINLHVIVTYWWQATLPATCSSIENLKKGRLEDFAGNDRYGEKMSCPICLEDFQAAALVKLLPCSHVFHANCIDQWLHESHYCPICRFEMPTDSELMSPDNF